VIQDCTIKSRDEEFYKRKDLEKKKRKALGESGNDNACVQEQQLQIVSKDIPIIQQRKEIQDHGDQWQT